MYKVIGNGMIGKAFKALLNPPENCIIFASGVSDSTCTDNDEFKKEELLIRTALNTAQNNTTCIYFGTCSVYDPDRKDTPYVLHKKRMEEIILSVEDGIVFRLPQIAGNNAPPNTILSKIRSAAYSGEQFEIWRFAERNILDVIDARDIVINLIKDNLPKKKCINVANRSSYSMVEIIDTFERVLKKEINKVYKMKGGSYSIDICDIEASLNDLNIDFNHYLERIICKYYS